MIGSLTDTLILIAVAILLLGGERDISGQLRELGKFLGNLRRSEQEFRRELMRELNVEELRGIGGEVARGVAGDVGAEVRAWPARARPYAGQPTAPDDPRVRELEEEVRRLREELEALRSGRVRGGDGQGRGQGGAPDREAREGIHTG
jgi:sec-independent protein translocase protein TatA